MENFQASSRNTPQPPNAQSHKEPNSTDPSGASPTEIQRLAFYRISQIIGNKTTNPPVAPLLPISRSSFYAGIKAGIYPAPVKLSARVSAWRGKDILLLLKALSKEKIE